MDAIKKVLEREDYASPADFAAAREEFRRMEEALRGTVSRLTLARASMRSYLRDGDRTTLEAWLLAEKENGIWALSWLLALDGER